MKDKKRFWLTVLIIAFVQYIPVFALCLGPYIKTGALPTAVESGLIATLTGIIYILLLKMSKLKSHVFPKALKIFSILNFAFGGLYLILGLTIFR